MRAVDVLEVERPELFDALAAVVPLDDYVTEVRSPTERVVKPTLLADHGEALRRAGLPVLVKAHRRAPEAADRARHHLADLIDGLAPRAQRLLHRAQRQARQGRVLGSRVWDPMFAGAEVRSLLGAGLIEALPHDGELLEGPFALHPDLPAPPEVDYDMSEAAMERVDDLSEPGPSLVALLHDLASLAAALSHHAPRRTLAGPLDKSTTKKLAKRLGDEAMARSGDFAGTPRWVRALRVLELLGAASTHPVTRQVHLEPGLETVLEGSTPMAIDRLVRLLIDADLQPALAAVRAALVAAGEGAVDEMIFAEELMAQHRDVLHAPWHRDGVEVYPAGGESVLIPFDDEGWERIEARQLDALLVRLERLGVVVRAEGVFAATPDGAVWASGQEAPMPPLWVSSDLGMTVPPGSLTPWERSQLEQLGRCTRRDVVDTYVLDRKGLVRWLRSHEVDEALALLSRRCPGLPGTVSDTLRDWARSAERVVLRVGAAA
jgi:hypothetical protein